jgi:hypothetical protein
MMHTGWVFQRSWEGKLAPVTTPLVTARRVTWLIDSSARIVELIVEFKGVEEDTLLEKMNLCATSPAINATTMGTTTGKPMQISFLPSPRSTKPFTNNYNEWYMSRKNRSHR